MTFGSALRDLTAICRVKRGNLADALGYDASYVSRWVNGIKLPAIGNNDALLPDIAAYIAQNSTPENRRKAAFHFSLDCDPENADGFAGAVADLLARAYHDTKQQQAGAARTGRENAVLSQAKETGIFPETIFDALRGLPPGKPVEMICTMPIHTQFKNNEQFFRQVRASLPPKTDIHILQFVDPKDIAARLNTSCRSFFYLMGSPQQVEYDFYELPAQRPNGIYCFLVRDGLLLQYLREPISEDLLMLESADSSLVGHYCAAVDTYIMNRSAMAGRPDMGKLLSNQYFLDYFMQPRCRCLLRNMYPLFFPEELEQQLLAKSRDQGRQMGLFLDGSRFFETMILYKPAFVDYLYTGRLMAFGHMVQIPKKARLRHLQHMLEMLSRQTTENLFILSAQNRICNYEDLNTSLFTSRNAAFAVKLAEGRNTVSYTVSSNSMIGHINTFLDHLQDLPPEECLRGADALDYIERCTKLL